jgi:tetratricopeptide (TPR) repeat protein
MESATGFNRSTDLRDSASTLELPFTDRVTELGKLEGLLERCSISSKGALILVLGEAGIGKTRLAQRFREVALSRNARWLSAKCSRADDLAPYSPWVQLLREFVNQASVTLFFKVCGTDVEQIVRLIPELSENAKTNLPVAQMTTEEEMRQRYLFYQSLTRFFTRLAEDSPLVLFFDDLQWADPATVELLAFFDRNVLKKEPILIFAACRDFEAISDQNQTVATFLKDVRGEVVSHTLQLDRFDNDRVEQLLANASRREDISKEFTSLIYSKTGGNPLFIKEVLRSLFEKRDIFTNEKGQWDRRPISEIDIPSTIVEVIKRRLERSDTISRQMLRSASVIGEKFDLRILRKIIVSDDALAAAVQFGVNAGLLVGIQSDKRRGDNDPDAYGFSDESVHDVLYEELAPVEVKDLHSKVGSALEEIHRDSLDKVVSELAYHYYQAGNQSKAFEYSVKAGDKAAALYAHEEAARHYKRALELLKGDSNGELLRAKILSELGEETYRFMGGDSGSEYLEEAANIFEKNNQRTLAGAILMRLSEIYFLAAHDKERVLAVSNKAAEILANESPTLELVFAMGIGYVLVNLWAGEGEAAREWEKKLEQIISQLGDPKMSAIIPDTYVEIRPISEKALVMEAIDRGVEYLQKNTNDVRMIIYGQFHRAVSIDHTRGPSDVSLKLLTEYEEYAEKTGYFDLVFYYKGLICDDCVALGYWNSARIVVEELFESLRRFPKNPTLYFMANLFRGRVLLLTGDLEQSEACLKKASKGRLLSPLFAQTAFVDLCRLYMERGDFKSATDYLEEGFRVSKSKGLTVFTALRHADIVSTMIELDIRKKNALAEAHAHLDEMKDVAKQIDEDWGYAYLYRAEGILYSNQLCFEPAIGSFKESIRFWEKLRWPYELAKTKYEFASTYAKSGNFDEARRIVEDALSIFEKLGAKIDIEKCKLFTEELKQASSFPKFSDAKTRSLFNYLLDSFVRDNSVENLNPDSSGWRTLVELAKNAGVPTSSLYGRAGQVGSSPLVRELLASGYVESKIFPGERGRGGEVSRFRVKYENAEVRIYAHQLAKMKNDMLR